MYFLTTSAPGVNIQGNYHSESDIPIKFYVSKEGHWAHNDWRIWSTFYVPTYDNVEVKIQQLHPFEDFEGDAQLYHHNPTDILLANIDITRKIQIFRFRIALDDVPFLVEVNFNKLTEYFSGRTDRYWITRT